MIKVLLLQTPDLRSGAEAPFTLDDVKGFTISEIEAAHVVIAPDGFVLKNMNNGKTWKRLVSNAIKAGHD